MLLRKRTRQGQSSVDRSWALFVVRFVSRREQKGKERLSAFRTILSTCVEADPRIPEEGVEEGRRSWGCFPCIE